MKQPITMSKNVIVFCVIYTAFFLLKIPSLFKIGQFQSFVLTLIVYTFLFIFGTWMFRNFFKDNLKWLKDHPLKSLGIVILIYITEVVVSLIVSIIYDLLVSFFQLTDIALQNDINIQNAAKVFNPIVGIFVLAFAGPIVEEIFFRLILISGLSKKFPSYIAILVSSIVFALLHVHYFELSEFINVITHFGLGIAVGIYFYKTQNIIFPIIIHVFINFSGVLPLYLN
ncbi:CPBP family intramembrane metalloprotease [Erwinia sp. CPCC 100877]|nr:CPBP family intramembrane metalloprotease [Erwinia sp. CPCC 100877]